MGDRWRERNPDPPTWGWQHAWRSFRSEFSNFVASKWVIKGSDSDDKAPGRKNRCYKLQRNPLHFPFSASIGMDHGWLLKKATSSFRLKDSTNLSNLYSKSPFWTLQEFREQNPHKFHVAFGRSVLQLQRKKARRFVLPVEEAQAHLPRVTLRNATSVVWITDVWMP